MNISGYIEKLRTKPTRERERIAVIATGVSFVIIFLIWLVSFNEMNKETQLQPEESSAASLNDLKNNFQGGKDSIQQMMEQLPGQTGTARTNNTNGANNTGMDDSTGNNFQNSADNSGVGNNNDAQNKESVPQLP